MRLESEPCHSPPRHRAAFRFLAVVLVLASGCATEQAADDQTVPVSGMVRLDMHPLATGRIVFIDNDGPFPRDYIAEITDGAFAINVSPGRRRVEIRSWKQPKTFPVPETAGPQIIPSRYNDQSELSVDLKAGDSNSLTFELKSEGI